MNEGEYKSTVTEVSDWVWGLVQGNFNDQQTISQILVDAVIGMIPLVGDVTAIRDLIAIIIGLAKHPEKREDKMEWVALVVMAFALIPVAGGVIKGIGKLLMGGAKSAAVIEKLIGPVMMILNRVGSGDAIKFLKELDLMKYADELKGKVRELFGRLEKVTSTILDKVSWIIPDAMVDTLERLRGGIQTLRGLIDRMIPDALKELNERLKLLQRAMYEGEWLEIPATLRLRTRENEARLIEELASDAVRKGGAMAFPPNKVKDFVFGGGPWPDLETHRRRHEWIPGFHGPLNPVKLKKGEKIYRVVQDGSRIDGPWWVRDLPPDGRAWREGCAVLESWNKNRWYVEYTVESDLFAYEGVVASQLDRLSASATYGQYLQGGRVQLLVDFDHRSNLHARSSVAALVREETHWRPADHLGVNVPLRTVAIQQLESHEIESKVRAAAVVTRGTAAEMRADRSNEREEHP
jgi:hypothetical protein